MQIESRVSGITRDLRLSGAGDVASRQRSVTSDPSGDASRASAPRKRDAFPAGEKKGSKVPVREAVDLKVTVEKLNKFIQDQRKDVAFSVDEEANATVIKIFKTTTGELIKQFPPEEILAMKAKLRKFTGWLVDKRI